MTDAIKAFSIDIPPGNGQVFDNTVDCDLGWSDVTQITIGFPPGPSKHVGIWLAYADNRVYPLGEGSAFVADDYIFSFPVTNQQQGGQWTIHGWNTDVFEHSITVWFFYNYVTVSEGNTTPGMVSL